MNTNETKRTTNRRQNQANSTAKLATGTSAEPRTARPGQASNLAALPNPMTAAPFREGLRRQLDSKRVRAKEDPQTEELVDWILQAEAKADALPAGAAQAQPKPYRLIKLGIDVHADRYVVVRQIEGGAPQPAQRFSAEQFVGWAKRQTELAEKVYTCYEAGPFGYSLHRRLTALGVTNYVVRPRDWDEYGQKVKTDKRDARELVLNLDRCVRGNDKAFCVVRVPSQAQEQARSRSRQREALQREKQRLAAQGRSQGLYYGARVQGEWWVEEAWQELAVPPIVLELLEPLRRLILAVEQELQARTKTITAAAPQELPAGLGKLTYETLEREVGNWDRFHNRRQVGSYTGMCPREDTSDQRRFQGSINKHGNPRVRTVIVEASWRLMRFQPTYKPVAKWRPILMDPRATKSKRKQIAVAIGRQFSVDWWRVRTGRCKAEDLGLTFKLAPTTVAPTPWAKVAKPTPADKP